MNANNQRNQMNASTNKEVVSIKIESMKQAVDIITATVKSNDR